MLDLLDLSWVTAHKHDRERGHINYIDSDVSQGHPSILDMESSTN